MKAIYQVAILSFSVACFAKGGYDAWQRHHQSEAPALTESVKENRTYLLRGGEVALRDGEYVMPFDSEMTNRDLQKLCFQVGNSQDFMIEKMCAANNMGALGSLALDDLPVCTKRAITARDHCGDVPSLQ